MALEIHPPKHHTLQKTHTPHTVSTALSVTAHIYTVKVETHIHTHSLCACQQIPAAKLMLQEDHVSSFYLCVCVCVQCFSENDVYMCQH